MTRKLIIAIAGIVAIIALGGFSATALAEEEDWVSQYCEFDNSIRAFDFAVRTDNSTANAVSGVAIEAKLCGTATRRAETYEEGGSGSHYVHVKVRTARGVEYNSTDAIVEGMYVGKLTVSTTFWFFRPQNGPWGVPEFKMILLADERGNGDCPVRAKACYRGVMNPTLPEYYWLFNPYNSVWVTERNGRHLIHIGEIRSNGYEDFRDMPFGIDTIDELSICANAGVNDSECGDEGQPFVRKNGDASPLGCPRRNGVYRLRAWNRDRVHTNSTRACVEWKR